MAPPEFKLRGAHIFEARSFLLPHPCTPFPVAYRQAGEDVASGAGVRKGAQNQQVKKIRGRRQYNLPTGADTHSYATVPSPPRSR